MDSEFKPRPDQIEDLAKCIANPRWMLLNDPGTGKTPTAALYTWWNWTRNRGVTVWLQPLAIIKKNRDEILRFTGFKPDDVRIVSGPPKQRKAAYAKKPKVLLMSADTFGREWKLIDGVTLVIGDEWQLMFSTNDSQRTTALYQAMKHIPRLLPMTGTLIRGRLSSAFPAIHLIEPRYYGNYRQFLNFHTITDFYGEIIDWINTEKITEILRRHSCRRSFASVHGEANLVIQTEYVQMATKQAEAYKEFHDKGVLELEKYILDGTLPGVGLIRARQILSCPELFDLGEAGRDANLEIHLREHIDTGEPLMIISASVPEQKRVLARCRALGLTAELMNGDTSQKRRGDLDEAFRGGAFQVMIASEAVAIIGFNWGHLNHIVGLTLDYFDDNLIQGLFRAIRGKRETPLRGTLLSYEETVEDMVLAILERKMKLANRVDPTKPVYKLHQRRVREELIPLGTV